MHDSWSTIVCPAINGLNHPARLLVLRFSMACGAITGASAWTISSSSGPPASAARKRAVGHAACRADATASRIERSGALSPKKEIRSEEHTSELQSLMRISYAVFCLKKKKNNEHIKQDKNK